MAAESFFAASLFSAEEGTVHMLEGCISPLAVAIALRAGSTRLAADASTAAREGKLTGCPY